MTGSIGDWFADRQDGSFGDSADDEVVEHPGFGELPPEDPEIPERVSTGPTEAELDALRRRNGLPGLRQRPATRPAARPPVVAPARTTPPDLPEHLRQRIVDFARLHPHGGPKGVAVELLRRGTPATAAQVAHVLRTLSPAERETLYALPASETPSLRGRTAGPMRLQAEVCGSCGTSLNVQFRCSCS